VLPRTPHRVCPVVLHGQEFWSRMNEGGQHRCDEDGEKQPQPASAAAARMLTSVRELATYITNNAAFIVNDGER